MTGLFRRTIDVCVFTVVLAASAPAQSFQGGLRGSVMDVGGALIPDAKVTLIDESTGTSRATLCNSVGEYVFNAVNPATYTFTVEAPGFERLERKGITIATQQFVTLELKGRHKPLKNGDADKELGAPLSVGIPARSLANIRCGGFYPVFKYPPCGRHRGVPCHR